MSDVADSESEVYHPDGHPLGWFVRLCKRNPTAAGFLWALGMAGAPILLIDSDTPASVKLALVGSWGVLLGGGATVWLAAGEWLRTTAASGAVAVRSAVETATAAAVANGLAVSVVVLTAGVVLVVAGVWIDAREVPDDD